MYLTDKKVLELKEKANEVRKNIVEMVAEAGSGHLAGALGMADIFTLFYFHILKHDPKNPLWEDRDRLVLSNGHICPVLYAVMAQAGYFSLAELKTLRKFGARLQGHPHREYLPYLETSSGPLGEGLSQAVGMALADQIDKLTGSQKNLNRYIYCFMSDAEFNEGNTWEALMLAGKNKLNNLITLIDLNNIQISGPTQEIMPLGPLKEKLESFNWNVLEVNGHDFKKLNEIIEKAQTEKIKPSIIIAQTIASKGIKQWENDYTWHGKAPNKEEEKMALAELAELKANFTI
jgi:transketolase